MSKLIYHPIVIFTLTIVGIVFFISLNKSANKTEISTQNIETLENEVHQMSGDVAELEEMIIETDSEEYKEKIIRNELLLQKPNEKIIQLPDLENQQETKVKNTEKNKPINQWLKLLR